MWMSSARQRPQRLQAGSRFSRLLDSAADAALGWLTTLGEGLLVSPPSSTVSISRAGT
jgi:hypothetical protein